MKGELSGYRPGAWPAEDGGPARRQVPGTGAPTTGFTPGVVPEVTHREVPMATMAVTRDPGELFLLRHTPGDGAVSWVERIDPLTLAEVDRSSDLAGGPMWPGGMAAHADGSLHVVFGNHAHRLSAELVPLASAELPRHRPYNSFIVLADGHLVAKDFGGELPAGAGGAPVAPDCELLVLDPVHLSVVARALVPEPSVARLSSDGSTVYVVGVEHFWRLEWDGTRLVLDRDSQVARVGNRRSPSASISQAPPAKHPDSHIGGSAYRRSLFAPRYRTIEGQTQGWDCVITGCGTAPSGSRPPAGKAGRAAWFLDDGAGSERYVGSFRGVGISEAPLHLVRVGLDDGDVQLSEICGMPGGLVANPPLVDERRGIAVGFDSSNGVVAGFDLDESGVRARRWQREQFHGSHMVLLADAGQVVTADHDAARMAEQLVVLDICTGEEVCRLDTGSPLQSVVFPAVTGDASAGADSQAVLYLVSFSTISRIAIT